jgi:histidyl-tRNA synthetase
MLIRLAEDMVKLAGVPYEVNPSVKRGLAYYTDEGFEISIPSLGAQKQVAGAGPYKQGIGFAIGVDRLLLAKQGL